MATEDIYTIAREPSETQRLLQQNDHLIRSVGYTLFPTIKQRLPLAPKVAELATGTGAFLLSLANELPPESQLDGSDYSDVAFLPNQQLPKNVSLSVVDAKQPAATELRGKYDLVCIRFLNAAMMPEDWSKVAAHAAQLLKPGGALQWIEGNFSQLTTILRSSPEDETDALEQGSEQAKKTTPHTGHFVENLSGILARAGFSEVKDVISSTDRTMELRKEANPIILGAIYGIMKQQRKTGFKDALTEEEIEALRKDMLEELAAGAYLRCDLHQFVAFKS